MKIRIDISLDQLNDLDRMAEASSIPSAEVIRQALASYVTAHGEPLSAYFGLWSGNPETHKVQGFLDQIRDEWT